LNKTKIIKTDYYAIGFYLIAGLVLTSVYHFNLLSQDKVNIGVLGFGLLGTIALYSYYYNRLRIFRVNFIWAIIATIQILIYNLIKSNTDFNNAIGGTYLKSLFYLPLLLIILAVLRLFYRLIFKRELIVNMRRYRLGETVENRKIVLADFLFTFIGLMLIIFGPDLINI